MPTPTYRIGLPPPTNNAALDYWLRQVADALNALPSITFVSGAPSGTTAPQGALAFNVASGATQVLWLNTSGTTSSWSAIGYT